MIPFLVFAFCLFLTFTGYLLATRGSEKKRVRLQKRLSEALLHSAHDEDLEVQLARQELMSEIPLFDRLLVRVQVATQLKRLLDQADLHITVTRLVMFSLMAAMLAGLAASMLTISLILIVMAGMAAAAVPFVHVVWARRKRLNKFLEDLPDALELMSRGLSAGHGFAEALHMVATEMPDPIATEFRKSYEEQQVGPSLNITSDANGEC